MKPEFNSFISYLKTEKHYSPHTISAYKSDLTVFFAFLLQNEVVDVNDIRLPIIRAWQVHLIENEISARSIARKISSIRAWFKYLKKQGIATENPLAKIVLPKQAKVLPSFLKESEMEALLNDVKFGETIDGIRDKLIIRLFYETGIRRAELLGLKVVDIDFGKNEIKVLGKRNKERIIPINKNLEEYIELYLQKRQELNLCSDSLFITTKDKSLSIYQVEKIVKEKLSLVCNLSKRSPHVLRHTFATHLLDNGAEINAIKELLGHSSLAATQVYTHNTIEKLKNTYKNAHPRAKNKGGTI